MKKIAIVRTYDHFYDYGDSSESLVKSITEWTVVDDDTVELLRSTLGTGEYVDYHLIEMVDVTKFITETVPDIIERIRQDKEKAEKRKQAAAKLKLEKSIKQKEKTEAAEKALLEKLRNKYNA